MFIIRDEQMRAFAEVRLKEFEERLMAHLRKYFPDHPTVRDPELASAYVGGITARAGEFGLESERAVASFAHVPLALGLDFDSKTEWQSLVELLLKPDLPADERARQALRLAHRLGREGPDTANQAETRT